jgi:hypothetical protein
VTVHPSISEQLAGLSRTLADVVRPELSDPYPIDVLDGVIAGLDAIARGWTALPAYLRWDAEQTTAILRRVGIDPPEPPADPLDLIALESHHAGLRKMLESAVPTIAEDPDTAATMVQLFRERIERFPFQQLAPRRP